MAGSGKILLAATLIAGCGMMGNSQDRLTLAGYISDMQSVYRLPDDWLWENSLHNRLNLRLYPAEWLEASLQVRTRLITGNTLGQFPGYAESLDKDAGWMDLSLVADGSLGDSTGLALHSMIDRLWVTFSFGNLEITAGRQRINWGQTFVWNPNDLFNTYSYFEVDYPERPGSDALRLQYYTGNASAVELAAKMDSAGQVTAAGYFRFNLSGYDIQFLGGVYSGTDVILGTGWSGSLGPAAFRGELTYLRELEGFRSNRGYLIASSGIDYTFPSSLWIQAELLYSAYAADLQLYNFLELFSGNLDVKTLAFTEWSVYSSLSYPFTPLLNGSLAAIYYPSLKGFFLGPSLDLSLNNNLNLSLILQYFSAELDNPFGPSERQNNTLGFLRIKWNF